MGKLTYIVATLLFIAAFSRSGYWIVTNPQQPLPDPTLYEGIGANLAEGNGFTFDAVPPYRPEITRTPLLPLMIAILYQFTGRNPEAVLWMNAVWVGLAVGLGYLLAFRLFRNHWAALIGGLIALLTPPVTGSANNILTEPFAMVQLTLGAWLLMDWPARMKGRLAPVHAGVLGLWFSTIPLNRGALTPLVLVAGAFVVWESLRAGRWRTRGAWANAMIFAVLLGTPVLGWSARNASVGLSFSPAPVGLYASRVFDIKRYEEHLLDPGEQLPRVNRQYFLHWKKHYGPEKLMRLEQQNKEWFLAWKEQHGDRILRAMPWRLLGLFSFFRNSIFPPWPLEINEQMKEKMRWISRFLWSLSLLGLAVSWRNRWARYIWLVPVGTIIVMHLPTVCHSRYAFPLLPLLMPYGGVFLVFTYRHSIGRAVRRFRLRKAPA